MFWLLTLPFRIVFGLLFVALALPLALLALPFALLALPFVLVFFVLRVALKAAIALVVFPIALLLALAGAVVTLLVLGIAVLSPLLPLAFIALCIWAVVRLASRPAIRPI